MFQVGAALSLRNQIRIGPLLVRRQPLLQSVALRLRRAQLTSSRRGRCRRCPRRCPRVRAVGGAAAPRAAAAATTTAAAAFRLGRSQARVLIFSLGGHRLLLPRELLLLLFLLVGVDAVAEPVQVQV